MSDLRAAIEKLTSKRKWQRSSILTVEKKGMYGSRGGRLVDKCEGKVIDIKFTLTAAIVLGKK